LRLPSLDDLPGFPVRGGGRPFFADLNSDGFPEMISASVDGKLYVRSLRFRGRP
jgi:hypothetical protein